MVTKKKASLIIFFNMQLSLLKLLLSNNFNLVLGTGKSTILHSAAVKVKRKKINLSNQFYLHHHKIPPSLTSELLKLQSIAKSGRPLTSQKPGLPPQTAAQWLSTWATEPVDWVTSWLFPSPAAWLRQWLNPVGFTFPMCKSEVILIPASYMHSCDEALRTAPTQPMVSPTQASVLAAPDSEPGPEGAEHLRKFLS